MKYNRYNTIYLNKRAFYNTKKTAFEARQSARLSAEQIRNRTLAEVEKASADMEEVGKKLSNF